MFHRHYTEEILVQHVSLIVPYHLINGYAIVQTVAKPNLLINFKLRAHQ